MADRKTEIAAWLALARCNWSLPRTREEAEANERAKSMRCRGPHKLDLTALDYDRLTPAVQAALAELPKRADREQAQTSRELIAALLERGRLAEARLLDDVARQGCGADFADIVCAYPFDGRTREYECPKCGLTGTFTSPIYHIIDDE